MRLVIEDEFLKMVSVIFDSKIRRLSGALLWKTIEQPVSLNRWTVLKGLTQHY